jgi:type VI protein secretion system component VasF
MTEDLVLAGSTTPAPRAEHPQQLLGQINDAFYEAADAIAQLREQLVLLAEHLESRFAAEEQSGRFEDVLCRAPWLTPQAQDLQQQHVPLVEMVRGLQRMCDADDNPVAWWERVRREFEDFAETLQEHEEGDDRLLQQMHGGLAWEDQP